MATVTIKRPVPQRVRVWQIKYVLADRSLLAAVNIRVNAASSRVKVAWEQSEWISRDSPAFTGAVGSLSWSSGYIDELFRDAARVTIMDPVS
jgi:hypothetical protein